MCGISGVISECPDRLQKVTKMGEILKLRGPDVSVTWSCKEVEIRFERLAINGGTEGNQPFEIESGRISVFCNGEIYNSKELRERFCSDVHFRSQSDCEVLVYLYQRLGLDFVQHLNGMFYRDRRLGEEKGFFDSRSSGNKARILGEVGK